MKLQSHFAADKKIKNYWEKIVKKLIILVKEILGIFFTFFHFVFLDRIRKLNEFFLKKLRIEVSTESFLRSNDFEYSEFLRVS